MPLFELDNASYRRQYRRFRVRLLKFASPQGGFRYKVFHSADLVSEYDEEQLAASEKKR